MVSGINDFPCAFSEANTAVLFYPLSRTVSEANDLRNPAERRLARHSKCCGQVILAADSKQAQSKFLRFIRCQPAIVLMGPGLALVSALSMRCSNLLLFFVL